MLTEEQEKRLGFVTQTIDRFREEQRILYAIRDGVYITTEEKDAQIDRASKLPIPKEVGEITVEPIRK